MSSGGGKPKMKVTEYFISAHYGVCMGPVDEVTEVWYGEKKLWTGRATKNESLVVMKPDLFGGEKVEGGFRGAIQLFLGGATQVASDGLIASLIANGAAPRGGPADIPGYRGILSVFITSLARA